MTGPGCFKAHINTNLVIKVNESSAYALYTIFTANLKIQYDIGLG